MPSPPPTTVRRAAALVAVEGVAAVIAAVVFVFRGVAGADQKVVSGFGNAAWFAVIGAAVLGAAWALWTGRRWGRGLSVYTQMLLLPVTWYAGVGSHRWPYALPVAAVAIAVLVLLFHPATLRWLGQGPSDSAASATNSGPDTR